MEVMTITYNRVLTWSQIVDHMLSLPKHTDVRIEKRDVAPMPSCFKPRLGIPVGQYADYGLALPDGRGIHLKEYDEYFDGHWDLYDPSVSAHKHLIFDAPKETALGLILVGAFFVGAYKYFK